MEREAKMAKQREEEESSEEEGDEDMPEMSYSVSDESTCEDSFSGSAPSSRDSTPRMSLSYEPIPPPMYRPMMPLPHIVPQAFPMCPMTAVWEDSGVFEQFPALMEAQLPANYFSFYHDL
jgi:hypothetical protein